MYGAETVGCVSVICGGGYDVGLLDVGADVAEFEVEGGDDLLSKLVFKVVVAGFVGGAELYPKVALEGVEADGKDSFPAGSEGVVVVVDVYFESLVVGSVGGYELDGQGETEEVGMGGEGAVDAESDHENGVIDAEFLLVIELIDKWIGVFSV